MDEESAKDLAAAAEWWRTAEVFVIPLPDEPEADRGVGVGEPRHGKPSGLSGGAALPIPQSGEDEGV